MSGFSADKTERRTCCSWKDQCYIITLHVSNWEFSISAFWAMSSSASQFTYTNLSLRNLASAEASHAQKWPAKLAVPC